ncbi:MAG: NEW3 domain-containing protein [Porphyromonadaceae bacterium]|nr:NEW3 domain-containing protein [Porphyromonadaceae bacterium]
MLSGSLTVTAQSLRLYTPYPEITVPPGETIDYSIDLINNGASIATAEVTVDGIPETWSYTLRSGGWSARRISVLPGEKKTLNLKVELPYDIDKGSYTFRVLARNHAVLPITIEVSEKGTVKTEFTADQGNMQGHATSNFNYKTKLENQTGEKQLYALTSHAPRGWTVVFKPNYQQASSVEIEPGQSKDISVEIKPPYNVKAGKYTIPVMATTGSSSARLELEADISGSYGVELTTPDGRLSEKITAGRRRNLELMVRNSGSTDLNSVRMTAVKPRGWEVTFTPDTIPFIAAGESTQIRAEVKAYGKAIPGDYVINLTAQTPEINADASFRMSVRTPLLWGWLGILIILSAIGTVYWLFRKYGRR